VVDVFGGPSPGYTSEEGKQLKRKSSRPPHPLGFSRQSDDDSAGASGDYWVDTDVDGSETESEFAFGTRGSPEISVEA
jgi:hypothetical protein